MPRYQCPDASAILLLALASRSRIAPSLPILCHTGRINSTLIPDGTGLRLRQVNQCPHTGGFAVAKLLFVRQTGASVVRPISSLSEPGREIGSHNRSFGELIADGLPRSFSLIGLVPWKWMT